MDRSLYPSEIFSTTANELFSDVASDKISRGLYRMLKFNHKQTAWHSVGVARIASGLVTESLLKDIVDYKANFVKDALLHDIGKLSVSNVIIDKPGRLNDAEMDIIKKHPWIGLYIIKSFIEDDNPDKTIGLRVLLSHYFQKDYYPVRDESESPKEDSIDAIFDRFKIDTSILENKTFMLGALSLSICDHFDARYPVKKDVVNSHDYNYRPYSVESLPMLIEASFTESRNTHSLNFIDEISGRLNTDILEVLNYIGNKAIDAADINTIPNLGSGTPFNY